MYSDRPGNAPWKGERTPRTTSYGGTRKFYVGGGASRGQNATLRGKKSKKFPKMADFGHFFLTFFLTGGKWGGGQIPPCPSPPCRHWKLCCLHAFILVFCYTSLFETVRFKLSLKLNIPVGLQESRDRNTVSLRLYVVCNV